MSSNIQVSWEDFYEAQRQLVANIKASGKEYKYIVTIPSGGLMPAYCLSKALNLPVVTINIKSYVEQGHSGEIRHTNIAGFGDKILNQDEALIVDDMYDSGKTIHYLQDMYPQADIAVTYARYADNTATYVGKVLDHDTWLDFPWEVGCGDA